MVPVGFLHDAALPNRHAATIQMVRTAAAMAAQGRQAAFLHGPADELSDVTLTRLGATKHEHLTLAQGFGPSRLPGRFSRVVVARRLLERRDGPHVLIGRGDTGMNVLPSLSRWRGKRPVSLIFEVHRLAGLSVAEAMAGRSYDEPTSALWPIEARRAHARDVGAAMAADGHVFLTDAVREEALRQGFPMRPHIILPSGADVPDVDRVVEKRDLDVVYAGKLADRKGVPDLLAAMALLPDHRADIAGGDERAVAAAKTQAPSNVSFHGWLEQAAVSALFARAKVGVCLLPLGVDSVSDRFTSPMKLLQMMAHGLAVVATDTPAVRAVVTDGHDALLVGPGDPAAASAAIASLLADEKRRARLGTAARRTARQYDWHNRAASLGRFADLISTQATNR